MSFLRLLALSVLLSLPLAGCHETPSTLTSGGADTSQPAGKPPMFESEEHLIEVAQVIVVGTIVRVLPARPEPYEPGGQAQRLVTDSVLRVEEVLKGTVQTPRIRVQQAGGVAGEQKQLLEHIRYYRPGDHLLLFLDEIRPAVFQSMTWFGGEYWLVRGWGGETIEPRSRRVVTTTSLADFHEVVKRVPDRSAPRPTPSLPGKP